MLIALRGQSDCPELVAQVVRLFVPTVLKHQFRPRRHPFTSCPGNANRRACKFSACLSINNDQCPLGIGTRILRTCVTISKELYCTRKI
ncbi:hypothetical protein HW555_008583 [Spodoptera exigua]|uniref:Uncharacterized protein n=1 Tax=Spodoptera exigua TaxID=7107 RepID=A0A835L4C7_SPOEX|nr:hypothetical protein HW555_008583 [Spodoptera exigua]